MSDIEAKMAQLAAQDASLESKVKSQPSLIEIVVAIDVRLAREGQILREDFVGKFAGHITPFIDTVTTRVKNLGERLSEAEDQELSIKEQIAAHEAKVVGQLAETEKKQLEILNWFVDALNQHHKINAATLTKQQVAVEECQRATGATAKAAALCTSFAEDYKATSAQGKKAVQALTTKLRSDLQTFIKGIKEDTSTAIMPTIERAHEMTEEEYFRRGRWIAVGIILILLISGGLTWFAQPSHYMMRDAAKWRTFESDLNQDQADRINKVLNEIQAEQKAEEEKNNK